MFAFLFAFPRSHIPFFCIFTTFLATFYNYMYNYTTEHFCSLYGAFLSYAIFYCSRLCHALFVPSWYICTIVMFLTLKTLIFREKSRCFFDISPSKNSLSSYRIVFSFLFAPLMYLNEGH